MDFQEKMTGKNVLGIVFYTGSNLLPFSDENHERYAVPLSLFFSFNYG